MEECEKFSILICTYNGSKRIDRVLGCVLNQTNLEKYVSEIIVIDNCSTDNIETIVMDYAAKHNLVKYIFEEKPGLSNARLCGINHCKSEWIIFLDDDNYLEDHWIEAAYSYIENKKNVGAFNGNVIPFFENHLNNEENLILKAAYLGLACSTYSKDSNVPINEKKWKPFGAGLVIKTMPLKTLAEMGWLKHEGRKGKQLISGEDTEMVEWVRSSGYTYGFCNEAYLYHDIGTKRLNVFYLKQLYQSFGEAHFVAISNKKMKELRIIKWCLIESYVFIISLIINFIKPTKSVNYYSNVFKISRSTGFFGKFKKSLLIKKKD